jgi:hypothetical protein
MILLYSKQAIFQISDWTIPNPLFTRAFFKSSVVMLLLEPSAELGI